MTLVSEVTIMSQCRLKENLARSFKEKFHVILFIPDSPNWVDGILKAMRECTGITSGGELSQVMGERRSKQVLDKILEMDDHVKRNKNYFKNPIEFIVTPGEKRKEFRCHYSIYKGGQLLKDNLSKLPAPPMKLKILQTKSALSLYLEWEYVNPGYPYYFLIEYRSTDNLDEPWKQQKTKAFETKTTIDFEPGSPMEIRLATDTCIGRSEFISFQTARLPYDENEINTTKTNRTVRKHFRPNSPEDERVESGPLRSIKTFQIDNETSFESPTCLEVESVTDSTAELVWSPTTTCDAVLSFSYQVRYWQNGESPAQSLEVGPNNIGCRLEKLQAGATYFVNVVAVSEDGQGTSVPSKILQLTTLKTNGVRFAEEMVKRCEKIESENGLDLYAIPLKQSSSLDGKTVHYVFGESDHQKPNKTIMIQGGADTPVKSVLINGFVNYLFGVDWLDSFRFQLVSTTGKVNSNQVVTFYDININHVEGFHIPFTLTIIDTPDPGDIDTEDLSVNQKPLELILVEERGVIYDLSLAIFVANVPAPRPPSQLYMFDSIMSVYSRKLDKNSGIRLKHDDILLKSIVKVGMPLYHKFDSSAFFCWNRKSTNENSSFSNRHHFQSYYREYKLNRFMWTMAMKNFQCLVSMLQSG